MRFQCKLDNGAANACASPFQAGVLEPGEHKFEVVGFTSANVQSRVATFEPSSGNVSNQSVTWGSELDKSAEKAAAI